MKAEIIAVGSELLLGQIANTNAQIISSALQNIGIDVYYHVCIGDNRDRLMEVFRTGISRSDIIIFTGGLGPTQDDLTKETVAACLNLPLVIDEFSLSEIKSFFEIRERTFSKNNMKQALIPQGAKAIANKNGTAPGVLLKHDDKVVIMLPGPPSELKPMLEGTVIPYLSRGSENTIYSRVMKFYGIGESALEEELKDLIKAQTNPTIAPLAKMGEVTIRLTAKAVNRAKAESLIKPIEQEITRRAGCFLYGFDDDRIEEIVAELLAKHNKTLAIAESCTGGLMAHKLTNIPGISRYFERGIVSYSNLAKHELLGVKNETLDKYGAVSEETCSEMARGIRAGAGTDIGVAITGIAGPDGGTLEKPVGLVYIGYADSHTTRVEKHIYSGERTDIKSRSANSAFHLVRCMLQNLDIRE